MLNTLMKPETSYLNGTLGKEHSRFFVFFFFLHLSVAQVVNTSSENSWRARFRFADLAAAVYIAEGGQSSATYAERRNVECPVPREAAGARNRDLTQTQLSAQLLVAREATLDGFCSCFCDQTHSMKDGSGNRMEEDVMGWGWAAADRGGVWAPPSEVGGPFIISPPSSVSAPMRAAL